MYKAVNMDENGDSRKEEELYQRLITENKVIQTFYIQPADYLSSVNLKTFSELIRFFKKYSSFFSSGFTQMSQCQVCYLLIKIFLVLTNYDYL